MNNVILMGRLVRDPIQRKITSNGEEIETSYFVLAVDRAKRKTSDKETTADFISCQAFRKTAETINKFLHQGSKICLRGHIQTGSYTNKEGQKVYTTDVIVDTFEFAESKATEQASLSRSSGDVPVFNDFDNKDNTGFMSIPDSMEDEGLPFK